MKGVIMDLMTSRFAAPGQLELVRRFVNTLDIEAGTDALADPAAVGAWLSDQGLWTGGRVSAAEAHLVVRLREALRAAMLANHDGADIPSGALDIINATADRARLHVTFTPPGGWEPRPGHGGVDGALGRLLAIMAEAMAAGTWRRLKACLNDRCRWAFYDHSNARSSKWCDMRICGNRVKQQAWRARTVRG
jgi:predicted RNA-binding Zn ribbon-like protein